MSEELPTIGPETWEDAAGLCAYRIDVEVPSDKEKISVEDTLELMRARYEQIEEDCFRDTNEPVLDTAYVLLACAAIRAAEDHGFKSPDIHAEKYALTDYPTAESLLPLLRAKQMDYGYGNINRFGRDGIIVRIHDKIARIENLISKGADSSNEPLADSFTDLVGYCVIGMMVEYDIFNLPMRED